MSKENFSADEILAMKNKSSQEVMNSVQSKLSDEKKDELFKILGNKEALNEILKSDKARAIMQQLSGKE